MLTQLIGAEMNSTVAALIVAFFALSGVALTALAYQETLGAYEASFSDTKVVYHKTSQAVLGEYLTVAEMPEQQTYQSERIFKSSFLELSVTPFEYSEHVDKWNYKISWNRSEGRTGSIYINGRLLKDNISGQGEVFTGFNLSPDTRYRLTYYTGIKGRGSVIVNRYFKTLEATLREVNEEVEERNSYDPLPPTVMCPQDVKICPDGSGVSRIAPACKFKECPTKTSTSTPANTEPEFKISLSNNILKVNSPLYLDVIAKDKEGGKLTVKVVWGDGQLEEKTENLTVNTEWKFKQFSHTFTKAGKFQIMIYAIDAQGAKAFKTATIVVENSIPQPEPDFSSAQ
jgi:hypothetical protein